MYKTHAIMLTVLFSAATALSAQTAPGSNNASQKQQDVNSANQAAQQKGGERSAPSSGNAGSRDCPPIMNQGAAERLDPPGPVGTSGSAVALPEDSGTLGSTGATRATTTSGATGTTGEFGSYRQDPSGSVTTAGSTGSPVDPSLECGPDADASGASGGRGDTASGGSNTKAGQQDQSQDKPTSHSDRRQ